MSHRICPNCGQNNPPKSSFCGACGLSVEAESEQLPSDTVHVGQHGGILPRRNLPDLLSATFSIFRSNIWGFVGMLLIQEVPSTLGTLVPAPGSWVLSLIGMFLFLLANGAMVYATANKVLGRECDIIGSYRRAWLRVVSLVINPIVFIVVLMGTVILMFVAAQYINGVGIPIDGDFLLLTGLPLFCFVLVIWFFYSETIMIEGTHNLSALRRSYEVVKGSWWRVFGIGVVYVTLAVGFLIVTSYPVLRIFFTGPEAGPDLATLLVTPSVEARIFFSALSVLILSFLLIGRTILYLDLRVRKDAYTLNRLAADLDR